MTYIVIDQYSIVTPIYTRIILLLLLKLYKCYFLRYLNKRKVKNKDMITTIKKQILLNMYFVSLLSQQS